MTRARRIHPPSKGERSVTASRPGFSLVEVLVAIVLFGITMSALGGLTLSVGQQAVVAWGDAQRTAVVTGLVNDLSLVDYDSLPARAGCTAIATGPFPHSQCINVSDVATVRRVSITVVPVNKVLNAYTLRLERTRSVAASPFNYRR